MSHQDLSYERKGNGGLSSSFVSDPDKCTGCATCARICRIVLFKCIENKEANGGEYERKTLMKRGLGEAALKPAADFILLILLHLRASYRSIYHGACRKLVGVFLQAEPKLLLSTWYTVLPVPVLV